MIDLPRQARDTHREKHSKQRWGFRRVQQFETHFSYFGARFVEVSGWPSGSEPTTDSMVCYFVHTALPRRSAIRFMSGPGRVR
jgi:hypothetical protein